MGIDLFADTFTRTVSPGGIGTADSGQSWSVTGASNWAVTGGRAVLTLPGPGTIRTAVLLGSEVVDSDQVVDFVPGASMTGASLVAGTIARYTSDSNFYWLRAEFDVGGDMTAKIVKVVDGVSTELGITRPVPGAPYGAGTPIRMRSSVVGARLSVKLWPVGSPEPRDWHLAVNDSSLRGAGTVGFRHWLLGNATTLSMDNYQVSLPRFMGEISSWPARWDLAGKERWVPVEASGVQRRLNQGAKAIDSALWRAYSAASPPPIAWWPLEDGRSADQVASGVPGVQPIAELGRRSKTSQIGVGDYSGLIEWGVEGSQGAASLVSLRTGGRLSAQVPASNATSWTFEFSIRFDAGSNPGSSFSLPMTLRSVGAWDWTFMFQPAGTVTVAGGSSDASIVGVTLVGPHPGWDGYLHHIRLDVEQSGANSLHFLWVDGSLVASGTWTGFLARVPDQVLPNFMLDSGDWAPSLGHLAMFAPHAPYYDTIRPRSAAAWYGESAVTRIQRLCAERGVPVTVSGQAADATMMGEQRPGDFRDLIAECAEADGGLLFEQRAELGLVYRSRTDLYNQAPAELSYSAGHISEPFEPVDDDDAIRNDVTVTRVGGSSARAFLASGPVSVLPVPDGVGVYDEAVTINLAADEHAPDQAGWRLHLGTVDEARYPRARLNLAAPGWSSNPLLTRRAATVDSGDVVWIGGLPDWLPPGPAQLMVRGYTETLDAYDWSITWNASPGSPWTVAVAGGPMRAPAYGSTLAAPLNSAALTLPLASTAENGVWTVDPVDFPMDLRVGGERVTASAIGPSVTDTFSRITSSGWGTANTGQVWTVQQGASAQWSTNGSAGLVAINAVNTLFSATLAGPLNDYSVKLILQVNRLAAGNDIDIELMGAWQDASNFFAYRLTIPTSNLIDLRISRVVAGAFTTTSATSGITHVAGQQLTLRFERISGRHRMKLWKSADPEPVGWPLGTTDTTFGAGLLGVRHVLATGNTSTLPVTVAMDDFQVFSPQLVTLSARGVNGFTRAWPAGTPVDVWNPAISPL
ncbi:hypothetical protein ACFYPX_18080 [Micromonospora zamorensis]|uniref:hypothetical protein n=1 Tax=Micromonospora zamorensis TaxID=709883 RepID=UPI00368A3F3A